MTAPLSTPYEPALDGLRAWAVAAVVLLHVSATSGLRLQTGGFIGVSLFFTLSGFLVTRMLLSQHAGLGHVDLARFWTRRVRRLAPASLVVVVAAVLLASNEWPGMRASDAYAGIWGYTNWHVIVAGPTQLLRTIVGPLGPFWSLAVEEQFYVFLVVVFAIATRLSRPVATLAGVLVAGWTLSVVIQITISLPNFHAEFATERRMSELLSGCLLAIALQRWPAILSAHQRLWRATSILGAVFLVGFGVVGSYQPAWLLHGGYAIVGLVSVTVIMGVLTHGRLARVLSVGPVVKVGVMSYSIYVVHWPVVLMVDHHFPRLGHWHSVVVKLVLAFLAAALLHYLVEQPIRASTASTRATLAIWIVVAGMASGAAAMLLV